MVIVRHWREREQEQNHDNIFVMQILEQIINITSGHFCSVLNRFSSTPISLRYCYYNVGMGKNGISKRVGCKGASRWSCCTSAVATKLAALLFSASSWCHGIFEPLQNFPFSWRIPISAPFPWFFFLIHCCLYGCGVKTMHLWLCSCPQLEFPTHVPWHWNSHPIPFPAFIYL